MADKLKTAPTLEPVTAAELKTWLRDAPDADSVMNELIQAAREFFEHWTSIAVIQQTRLLTLDQWPGGTSRHNENMFDAIHRSNPVELPMGNLISVESIKTKNAAGDQATFAEASYIVDNQGQLGRIAPKAGFTWPAPGQNMSGIEIEYKAGFGAAASDVPASVKVEIKKLAAHYYENRETVGEMDLKQAPVGMQNLIRRMRVMPGI